MAKTYDRAEWNFICKMMEKLGFHDELVKLVFECISTVSYSLIKHGAVEDNIIPQRGIIQGDPLSPYLFLICAKGFSTLLKHAELSGDIKGIEVARRAPSISHLFFADDSVLFLEATRHACRTLKRVFEIYEMAAGQKIDLAKSAIAFSPNTPVQLRNEVSSILAIPIVEFHEKYLGLPTVIGRKKKECFNGIKERLRKKLNIWKEKLLSKAGKALLIKAVAQSILDYAMGVFKLPVTLCADLNSMISKFWWENSECSKGISWAKWVHFCFAKDEGGIGFRDLESFNKALVAKQCWRLLTNEQTMIHKVFDLGCELLLSGLRKRIGDGQETLVYGDAWIPRPNFFRPISSQVLDQETKAGDVKEKGMQWDCWILFETKNTKYFLEKSLVPRGRSYAQNVIFNRAHYLADEYESLVKGEPKLIVEKQTKWSPPLVGKYKLNVDAAFIPKTGVGGIGAVVRNRCCIGLVDAQNGSANTESNLVMREVKVGGLHKVSMWDFVQVVVVATRVMEIRFGNWELRQVSSTSEVVFFQQEKRRGCLGASRFDAGLSCLIFERSFVGRLFSFCTTLAIRQGSRAESGFDKEDLDRFWFCGFASPLGGSLGFVGSKGARLKAGVHELATCSVGHDLRERSCILFIALAVRQGWLELVLSPHGLGAGLSTILQVSLGKVRTSYPLHFICTALAVRQGYRVSLQALHFGLNLELRNSRVELGRYIEVGLGAKSWD
ncbi:hypothetical protein L3X38_026539 [Prunus dulcis]|uniref:Reverse transcriptase domain-containing protein n=1 Tax=Prunus dulcis TaxID=3755 RepID=A0AAD4Z0B1_PRUDU|nr:hypothetical protein L3X38_026539 [Prunus dulcis]